MNVSRSGEEYMQNGNGNGLEMVRAHPLGFLQEETVEDRRNLKIALLIALLFHIALVFLVLPEVRPMIIPPKPEPPTRFYVAPPDPKQLDDWEEIETLDPIPVPDPTPNEPEPPVSVIDYDDAPAIEPDVRIRPDDMIPPGPPDVVDEDREGLTMPQVNWASIRANLKYPEMGIKTRTEGYVEVQAILRRDGTVDGVEVVGGTLQYQWFRDAAVNAVRKARFTPGVLYGRAVDVRMVLKIHFQLN